MLVISDLDDVFLPKPTDLLLNLVEARAGLEVLLGRIADMFKESHALGSAMGPALQAGYKLIVSLLSFTERSDIVIDVLFLT
jgi:protein transport protein SEC24